MNEDQALDARFLCLENVNRILVISNTFQVDETNHTS